MYIKKISSPLLYIYIKFKNAFRFSIARKKKKKKIFVRNALNRSGHFVKKHVLFVSNITKCLVEHAQISIKQRPYP